MIYCALHAIHVSEVSGLMAKAKEAGLTWKFQYIYKDKDHGLLVGPDKEALIKFLVEVLGFSHENVTRHFFIVSP